jgi:hypothetical protein
MALKNRVVAGEKSVVTGTGKVPQAGPFAGFHQNWLWRLSRQPYQGRAGRGIMTARVVF